MADTFSYEEIEVDVGGRSFLIDGTLTWEDSTVWEDAVGDESIEITRVCEYAGDDVFKTWSADDPDPDLVPLLLPEPIRLAFLQAIEAAHDRARERYEDERASR